jgi:hypothetical protein
LYTLFFPGNESFLRKNDPFLCKKTPFLYMNAAFLATIEAHRPTATQKGLNSKIHLAVDAKGVIAGRG